MGDAANYLSRCYAIRGGQISPWGTISVLGKGVPEPGEHEYGKGHSFLEPGLKCWNEKLVQYAKSAGHRVCVGTNVVAVLNKLDVLIEGIPFDEFVVVEIRESYVHKNGYLEPKTGREGSDGTWEPWLISLDQVAAGMRPLRCDNGAFVKVNKKFAGQEVMLISHGSYSEEKSMVFTKQGERIYAKTHFPLAFATWDPTSKFAKYSRTEEILN